MQGGPADAATGAALVVERCSACGADSFPPVGACRRCGARDTEAVEATKRGRVHSVTVNHQRWFPELEVPCVVVLVDLLDHPGVRVVGQLEDPGPPDVAVGTEVVLSRLDPGPDGPPVPWFALAAGVGPA